MNRDLEGAEMLMAYCESNSNKRMKLEDLTEFSITTWYEKFKAVTIKTVLVPIPDDVIEMFNAEDVDWNIEQKCSAEFKDQLRIALRTFRSPGAFIKNNWHAPMDAQMLSFDKTMSVCNIPDLFLFLNGSNILANDFTETNFSNYCIALRQWTDINPAYEFRCIVINDILRGITPRDWPCYFPYYSEHGEEIIDKISQFFDDNIKAKFSRPNYIFDVFVKHPSIVILMDFGPLNQDTALHAFDWSEVIPIIKKNSQEPVAPVFRYLDRDIAMMGKAESHMKMMRNKYKLN